MRTRTKTLLWIALPIVSMGVLLWFFLEAWLGNRSAYYEWGVTCIIVSCAEEHDGVPPSNWHDLIGYEYHSRYLPEPRSIDDAAQHVVVDFDSLLAFDNGVSTELPADVIQPLRGFEQHWINPAYVLERYFCDGIRPPGSFDKQCADSLRHEAEQRLVRP